jgi:filamentous hemagglutinin family protein
VRTLNQVYRLVWSCLSNSWVAVAETARGRGKGAGRTLAVAAVSVSAATAQAAPVGGQVVSGSGSTSRAGTTTTITQSSQSLVLNWKGFDIAANETVNFVQPSASAIAVNRIFSTSGTQILGHLNANGQVYLINPNGILFGRGAQVNVGGMVASTLDVEGDSLGGPSRSFRGQGTGSVINEGTITARNGGYVALLGNTVSNQGTIVARLGSVAIGAGSAVTLTFDGDRLVNLQVDKSTLNNLAANGGLIQADGGMVVMSAGSRDALLSSVVNNTGVIEARTFENHGGTITLLGGMAAGQVNVGGTLDAGAPNGGNGGYIETSAAHVSVANDARITTASLMGLAGTWLVDPHDFTVAASGGDISGAALSAALAGTNVTLQSSQGAAAGSGNLNVNDTVSWGANTTLTLTASNNVNVNASITATGNTAGLVINPNTANSGEAASGTGSFNLNDGAAITLSGVNPGLSIAGHAYTVINSLGAAGSTTGSDLQGINGNLSGYYALGSNIDASATGGMPFTPIGAGAATPFSGVFEGLGHTIGNLTINQLLSSDVGLFGYVANSGVIRNVGLVGVQTTGTGNLGSLAGVSFGTISNSYATGNVNGGAMESRNTGGLVGANHGTILNSYSTASVSGSYGTGGLVGGNYGTVSNSYATGSVNGASSVGGLVGGNYGTVSNSYATGSVSGMFVTGGLVGTNYGSVNSSFWDTTTSNRATSAGGVGLTTAQMKSRGGFTLAGWDFANTWTIYDGETAPLLRSFMTPLVVSANNVAVAYSGQPYSGGNGVAYSVAPNSALLGTISYGGSSQGAINPGSYAITPGGLYSGQQGYLIIYQGGTLTVTAAPSAVLSQPATPASLANTVNSIAAGIVARQAGGRSQSNGASPTIVDAPMLTQARGPSADTYLPGTSNAALVNAVMDVGGTGALQIVDGGIRLADVPRSSILPASPIPLSCPAR